MRIIESSQPAEAMAKELDAQWSSPPLEWKLPEKRQPQLDRAAGARRTALCAAISVIVLCTLVMLCGLAWLRSAQEKAHG